MFGTQMYAQHVNVEWMLKKEMIFIRFPATHKRVTHLVLHALTIQKLMDNAVDIARQLDAYWMMILVQM